MINRQILRNISLLFLFVLITTFNFGCYNSNNEDNIKQPINTSTFQNRISAEQPKKSDFVNHDVFSFKREIKFANLEDCEKLFNENLDANHFSSIEPPAEQAVEFINNYLEERMLTKNECVEDLDTFLNYHKKYYGYYNYYGEEAFETMRVRVLENIPDEGLSVRDFAQLIQLESYFVTDQHVFYNFPYKGIEFFENRFDLTGKYALSERWKDLYSKETYPIQLRQYAKNLKLGKYADKYYDLETMEEVLIEPEWSRLIQPTFDPEFGVVYMLTNDIHAYKGIDLPKTANYLDGSKKELEWSNIPKEDRKSEIFTQEEASYKVYNSEVFYLNLRGNVFNTKYYGKLNHPVYREAIKKSRDYPYLIVDLRTNVGGYCDYFLETYYGQNLLTERGKHTFYELRMQNDFERQQSKKYPKEGYIYLDNGARILPPAYEMELKNPNQRVIILADDHTHSAGERVMDSLRSDANTLIIGTSTSGGFSSSGGKAYHLPHSGMEIPLASEAFVYGEDQYTTDTGFVPDLYCYDMDINKLASYLCNHLNIKESH